MQQPDNKAPNPRDRQPFLSDDEVHLLVERLVREDRLDLLPDALQGTKSLLWNAWLTALMHLCFNVELTPRQAHDLRRVVNEHLPADTPRNLKTLVYTQGLPHAIEWAERTPVSTKWREQLVNQTISEYARLLIRTWRIGIAFSKPAISAIAEYASERRMPTIPVVKAVVSFAVARDVHDVARARTDEIRRFQYSLRNVRDAIQCLWHAPNEKER